jgi:hypothetical protein
MLSRLLSNNAAVAARRCIPRILLPPASDPGGSGLSFFEESFPQEADSAVRRSGPVETETDPILQGS